jgi:2-amino-4-hydroxy-6-hydroxymethyldihydropteridine diphosphokinase
VTPRVAIGLGASLGDTAATLRLAVRALAAEPALTEVRSSRMYATPAAGGVASGRFVNAVVVGRCALAPEALLARLHALERRLGRHHARRWADRVLDLDLLLVEGTVLDTAHLTLPHPRMRQRAFVLVPLREVWPDAVDPRDGSRLADAPAAADVLPAVGLLGAVRGALRGAACPPPQEPGVAGHRAAT